MKFSEASVPMFLHLNDSNAIHAEGGKHGTPDVFHRNGGGES